MNGVVETRIDTYMNYTLTLGARITSKSVSGINERLKSNVKRLGMSMPEHDLALDVILARL